MKTLTASLVITLLLAAVAVSAEENKTLPKPFGIGIGPTYLGGRETDEAGTKLSLDIYSQYINYKRLMMLNLEPDEQYYRRWTDTNQCIGACPQYSYCKKGICVCNHAADSVVQIYGRCFGNRTASFVGDKEKYRKPTPPARPEWCFCEQKNGGKKVCDQHRNQELCKDVTYPNNFYHKTQMCQRGYHSHCLGKDINMFCGEKTILDPTDGNEKNVCQCRKDMKFDTKLMECRLFIDVDCTYETESAEAEESKLTKILKEGTEPDKEYTQKEIKSAFCNLIDSMGNDASTAVNTAVGVIGMVVGVAGLFWPVTAQELANGKFKVCSQFEKDELHAPFNVCAAALKGDCVERCVSNIPGSELPEIARTVVAKPGGEFTIFSRFFPNGTARMEDA